jgi:hypothetical protein
MEVKLFITGVYFQTELNQGVLKQVFNRYYNEL